MLFRSCFLREVLFYCFSPKRGAGITLSFVCLVICISTIAREFFSQFVAMPDRPPPLFRHIGHLITTHHCLLDRCVFIENTKKQLLKSIKLIIKFIKQINYAERLNINLHIMHKVLSTEVFYTMKTNLNEIEPLVLMIAG